MIIGIFGFQSTLPARGATRGFDVINVSVFISIHAPREGSDTISKFISNVDIIFQSTLPARGATYSYHVDTPTLFISIHAPREGSDLIICFWSLVCHYFNPRSPRGERPICRARSKS